MDACAAMFALKHQDSHIGSASAIASTVASITERYFMLRRYSLRLRLQSRRNPRLCGTPFCPHCGSPVFGRSADEIELNLGSLDAPDQFKPTYELWTIRRESWLPPFPNMKGYERDRDGSSRFED